MIEGRPLLAAMVMWDGMQNAPPNDPFFNQAVGQKHTPTLCIFFIFLSAHTNWLVVKLLDGIDETFQTVHIFQYCSP